MYFFLNVATSVCCPIFHIRKKGSLAKGKSIYSYIGILYPTPKISNPNLNLKLRWRKILPLAPRNFFLLAPTCIFFGIRDSRRFFWGIPLHPPLRFTMLLLSWGDIRKHDTGNIIDLPFGRFTISHINKIHVNQRLCQNSLRQPIGIELWYIQYIVGKLYK